MSLCPGSQGCVAVCNLILISGHEQPRSLAEDIRGIDKGLCAPHSLLGIFGVRVAQFAREDKPKFTGHRHCTSGILRTGHVIHAERRHRCAARTADSSELPEAA
jgi:hypothetical protein